MFAGITGDLNPFHVNEAYSKNTFFKGRIAHGMLLAGFSNDGVYALDSRRTPDPVLPRACSRWTKAAPSAGPCSGALRLLQR
ncbi:MAG: MaoC/PaaZ C-terminal domain-containing protein [Desulfobacteraceae bacterium]